MPELLSAIYSPRARKYLTESEVKLSAEKQWENHIFPPAQNELNSLNLFSFVLFIQPHSLLRGCSYA